MRPPGAPITPGPALAPRRLLALVLVVGLAASLAWPAACLACFGARPLAMGGAFVAVADDLYATYWNQAGLARLPAAEVGATFDTDWQDLNYDVVAGVAAPVAGRAGLGLIYVYNEDDLGLGVSRRDHYLQAGGGFRLWPWAAGPSWADLSVGLGGKYIQRDLSSGDVDDSAHVLDMDVSLLLEAGPAVSPYQRMFSFGLLLQNVLESNLDYSLFGLRERYATNVRPAVALRPDAWTTLALEVYDASAQADSQPGLRLGAERWLGLGLGRPVLALRTGAYHINQEELRAYTFGLGLRPTPRSELSYALMYWTDSGRTTHLVAASYRF